MNGLTIAISVDHMGIAILIYHCGAAGRRRDHNGLA